MRLNQYLAQATGMSRRAADKAIETGHVKINEVKAVLGSQVATGDHVTLAGKAVSLPEAYRYLMLNKPVGYVTSRAVQGKAPTLYELLPEEYHRLKPVGRLDKDSSGLMLLTDDGNLANNLTHPSQEKLKTYLVELSKPLGDKDRQQIADGVRLEDGLSRLELDGSGAQWTVRMSEGRNRQIRRTFEPLGYRIATLHRTGFGKLELGALPSGGSREIERSDLL
jgi:23S rRNA pseudouridine2605 synthase